MARIGINPARGKISDYRPARISLTLLSYIPELTGYFADRLNILSLSVASLIQNTPAPYDLVIFDNGSCREVVDFWRKLQESGAVDYLILSDKNIGKIGALRLLFSAAPGEIMAYCDDDILFYPGWLPAHLEILEAFPNAGMVSGVPVRNAAGHAHSSLDRLVQHPSQGMDISFERWIPDEWEVDWATSTGRNPQTHLHETREDLDPVLKLRLSTGKSIPGLEKTVTAIGSANHFQFVTRKELILQALPQEWSGKLMGHMLELDQAVDDLGYLRLSTAARTTRHLGNTLSPELLRETEDMGLPASSALILEKADLIAKRQAGRKSGHNKSWILQLPGARRILVWVYKRLFDILYR